MTPQQTKISLAVAAIVLLLGGLTALNETVLKDKSASASAGDGQEGVDLRQSRLNFGSGRGGAGGNGADDEKNGKNRKGGANGSDDAGLASIIDAATTTVMPIETEAETRERERYEKAMANQFKYRKLDPEKIKPAELAPTLDKVSEEYGIPDDLLAAMMYVETGGAHRDGDHSMEAGYGVMNLRENNMVDTLAEAASLLGLSKEDILYDQAANMRAAGALLRSYYDDAIASGLSQQEAWYMAVSQYSGRSDPELAAALADETAGWMMKGFEVHQSDGGGDLVVPPNSNPPFHPKNWELVGMSPPGTAGGQQANNSNSQNNRGSAAGGYKVTP